MAAPQASDRSIAPLPPPPAAGRDRTPHLEVWRAISRRAWILLMELCVGPTLFGLQAVYMMRYAPDTLPFFHHNAVLPIAVLVGFRVGCLIFAKLVASYMVRSIRNHGWTHDDSVEAHDECIWPALILCKFLVLAQTLLAFAECLNALRLFAFSPHRLHAVACWPMIGVCATAAAQLAVELARLDHWKDALGKLHAIDVAKMTTNSVYFDVPAKLRTLTADEEKTTCCICLSECMPGEALAELRCKHVFHEACIKTWFGRSDSCPLRCSTGSVTYGKQPIAKQEVKFAVGDDVEVKSTDLESWMCGKVVSTAPLLVRPHGWLYAYPWDLAKPSATGGHEHQD